MTWRKLCLALLGMYVAFFAFNAWTRTRNFEDNDTMNFVDVARHIGEGQGARQATLGMNQPKFEVNDPIPTPLTHQPPLYPYMIAGLARLGLSATDAAVLISLLGYGFILLSGYAIAARLFGTREALATLLLLALYVPLREYSQSAFSEPPGIALMLASMWLLVSYALSLRARPGLAALAGVAAAGAVATRYALAPVVVVGACFVLIRGGSCLGARPYRSDGPGSPGAEPARLAERLRDAALFLGAPALAVVLILWRNLTMLHGSLLPHYLPSDRGYFRNFRGAAGSLVSQYAGESYAILQFAVLLALLAALVVVAVRGGRLRQSVASILLERAGAQLLTLFAALYVLFLIVERSHSSLDPIDARLLLPAACVIILLLAAFVVRATAVDGRSLAMAGCVATLGLIGFQLRTLLVTPPYDPQRVIADSERLSWLRNHTSAADAIIGEDTVDVSFFLQRPFAVSYSPFPYTETLPYPKLLGLCHRFKADHDRVLLVVRKHPTDTPEKWRARLGAFIQNVTAGELEHYPGIEPLADLRDGRVLKVDC